MLDGKMCAYMCRYIPFLLSSKIAVNLFIFETHVLKFKSQTELYKLSVKFWRDNVFGRAGIGGLCGRKWRHTRTVPRAAGSINNRRYAKSLEDDVIIFWSVTHVSRLIIPR